MSDASEQLYRGGLAAVDDGDLDAAKEAVEKLSQAGSESSVEVLHLRGMLAWAQGDPEHAAGYLMQAADAGSSRAEVYLDCAELELELGELDEAEAALRVMLRLDGVPVERADEGRLLLAQVRRFDDDPAGGLKLLDEIQSELKDHAYYHAARATVLLELGRAEEALTEMKAAVEGDADDPDRHWELGVVADAAGDTEQARSAMLRTWELDNAERDDESELTDDQTTGLRAEFEAVLEELPDELMKLLAGAPIHVAAGLTREEVGAGADPRNPIMFGGQALSDDADGKLDGITVLRDVLLDAIEDDDDIPDAMFHGLMAEVRRFFKLERLTVVDVGD